MKNMSNFTFVELIIVLVIITLFFCMILPAVNATNDSAKKIKCTDNMKKIVEAWKINASDNEDTCILVNYYGPSGYPNGRLWSHGLNEYVSSMSVFACPESKDNLDKPTLSFNWNSTKERQMITKNSIGYNFYFSNSWGTGNKQPARKITEIKQPDKAVIFADSYNAEDTNANDVTGYAFIMHVYDAGKFSGDNQVNVKRSVVTRHDNMANLTFADGHVAQYNSQAIETPFQSSEIKFWGSKW